MKHLEQLVAKYTSPKLRDSVSVTDLVRKLAKWDLSDQLIELWRLHNGCMAFESSLHLFPIQEGDPGDVIAWNENGLWKSHYEFELPEFFCFAENVFGEQFCTYDGAVCQFDPETGSLEEVASSIDRWAQVILEEPDLYAGYSLAHDWQVKFGALSVGKRLVPRVPFVCGGAFEIDNLVEIEAVAGMRWRASLANQLKQLPDGAQIQFKIMD